MASGDDSATSGGRRRWSFALAACWAVLGTWTLTSGATWPGLAQLALAIAFLATGISPRFAAWNEAPLFGRK